MSKPSSTTVTIRALAMLTYVTTLGTFAVSLCRSSSPPPRMRAQLSISGAHGARISRERRRRTRTETRRERRDSSRRDKFVTSSSGWMSWMERASGETRESERGRMGGRRCGGANCAGMPTPFSPPPAPLLSLSLSLLSISHTVYIIYQSLTL